MVMDEIMTIGFDYTVVEQKAFIDRIQTEAVRLGCWFAFGQINWGKNYE